MDPGWGLSGIGVEFPPQRSFRFAGDKFAGDKMESIKRLDAYR